MNALASVRRKLPGMDAKIGRMVCDMADCENGPQVRGWIDVRPENSRDTIDAFAQTNWVAFLHCHTPPSSDFPNGNEYRVPVVQDEDTVVTEITKPDIFTTMAEAEKLANNQLPGFVNYIKAQL